MFRLFSLTKTSRAKHNITRPLYPHSLGGVSSRLWCSFDQAIWILPNMATNLTSAIKHRRLRDSVLWRGRKLTLTRCIVFVLYCIRPRSASPQLLLLIFCLYNSPRVLIYNNFSLCDYCILLNHCVLTIFLLKKRMNDWMNDHPANLMTLFYTANDSWNRLPALFRQYVSITFNTKAKNIIYYPISLFVQQRSVRAYYIRSAAVRLKYLTSLRPRKTPFNNRSSPPEPSRRALNSPRTAQSVQ